MTGLELASPRRAVRLRWCRLPVVWAVALIALLVGAGAASACSCVPPETREAASDALSRYDVVFEGTVVRTLPGAVVYEVDEVYSGEVPERILVSADRTSCGPGTPPRGTPYLFVGTSQGGIIRATGADVCARNTASLDGESASLGELVTEIHGSPSAPQTTLGSRAFTLAERPLTWLSERRVLLGIAVIAIMLFAAHHYRSRHRTPGRRR
ncbi:MAG: hypothetical protein ACK4UY_08625 [Dietzia sp.]